MNSRSHPCLPQRLIHKQLKGESARVAHKELMKINLQEQKFVINYSKTLSSQILEINVLVGPRRFVIVQLFSIQGNNTNSYTEETIAKWPERRSNFNQFMCGDIHLRLSTSRKNCGGKTHR